MLDPRARGVLLEALRPPPGFVVDRAIATTYTLDLTALLTAPVAFSMFDGLVVDRGEANTGQTVADRIDPFALLQAVRAHSERLTVFCEATCIAAPPKYRRLLTYLEGSIVQVQAPNKAGVFHPKVWVLRFTNADDEVRYRVLCLTRNLTFDRSWDTMLTLDGELANRVTGIQMNRPLSEFIAALPALSIGAVSAATKKAIAGVADEIRKVKFELPEGYDEMSFHPMGIGAYSTFPLDRVRVQRVLVVSPFVSAKALARLSAGGTEHVLLSRADELQALTASSLAPYKDVFVLHDGTHDEDDEQEPQPTGFPPSTGLHAKLFVADDGWNAHVVTGSANATTAAFERNVEFVVQLTGKKARCGVDAFLGTKGNEGLRALVAPYAPQPEPVVPTAAERQLEEAMRATRSAIAAVRWAATVGAVENKSYPFKLHARSPVALPSEVTVFAWPITVMDDHAQPIVSTAGGLTADFGNRSFDALTTFFAFRVRAAVDGASCEETFVLAVPLEGAPSDRAARILQSLLDDPAKVLRFLRMLLASDPRDVIAGFDEPTDEPTTLGAAVGRGHGDDSAVLEWMLRALDTSPTRIDHVEQLVRELSSTEEGRRSLPPEFLDAWEPIKAARATMPKGAR